MTLRRAYCHNSCRCVAGCALVLVFVFVAERAAESSHTLFWASAACASTALRIADACECWTWSMEQEELDAACVTRIARVLDEHDFRSFSLVCKLWRRVCLDESLPFWRVLNERRFKLLAPPGDVSFSPLDVLRAARRLKSVLTEIDLRGVVATHPTVRGKEVHRAQLAELLSLSLPCLRVLGLTHQLLLALPAGACTASLPSLHTLRLSHNAGVTTPFLSSLLDAAPSLAELYIARCYDFSETTVATVLAPRALRINLLDDAALPEAVDVLCGLCGDALWTDLRSFTAAPPTQPHISLELYTNVTPDAQATSFLNGDDRCLNCRRNCHAPSQLYLVDAGSGIVALHGWRYGIAIGDGQANPRRPVPPLATLRVRPSTQV